MRRDLLVRDFSGSRSSEPDAPGGSLADALLRVTVTINMPSRLKSATVTPEMRVSNVPTHDGLHTPYRGRG